MPNSFDSDSRGPSNRRLFVVGMCFLLVAAVCIATAIVKSKGGLDRLVLVSAELVNVGDGLPAKSDVKFRGVLVGDVSDVELRGRGRPNIVRIRLKPEYASGIPDTVTARVVPSNVFAVSSVQLVDDGTAGAPLQAGAVIHEDTRLSTVLFQSLLTKVRQLLKGVGREPTDRSVGILAALSEATEGRGDQIVDAGRDLNEIVTQLNTVVATEAGPSTISAIADATHALQDASPDLHDALDSAISPMLTFTEKRAELENLLSAGLRTVGTIGDAFDNQTDRLIAITTQLTPVVGVLADNDGQFQPIFTRVQRLAERLDFALDRETNLFTIKIVVSLTPFRTYVRADCPRYGALEGPSCQTAPEVPTAPALYPALGSKGYPPTPGVPENRPNLAPPRDSVRHAGEVPGGLGQAPPLPGPVEQPPPPGRAELPGPPGRAELPGPPGDVQPQAVEIGGNVGPVGSDQETHQLSRIVGGQANSSTELLLGPLVRGTTVSIAPDSGGDR